MLDIEKRIVTDEDGQPVAVQVDYTDWLEIERQLAHPPSEEEASSEDEPSLEELAEEIRPHWQGGDGLEYQRRLRAEWKRPWENSDT